MGCQVSRPTLAEKLRCGIHLLRSAKAPDAAAHHVVARVELETVTRCDPTPAAPPLAVQELAPDEVKHVSRRRSSSPAAPEHDEQPSKRARANIITPAPTPSSSLERAPPPPPLLPFLAVDEPPPESGVIVRDTASASDVGADEAIVQTPVAKPSVKRPRVRQCGDAYDAPSLDDMKTERAAANE